MTVKDIYISTIFYCDCNIFFFFIRPKNNIANMSFSDKCLRKTDFLYIIGVSFNIHIARIASND